MEDDDAIISIPDSKGLLDLTNRGYRILEPLVYQRLDIVNTLIVLDLSYNHLISIPSQIQELKLLRELRASFNKIKAISPEICNCKRLRKLILNGNLIREVPTEIGKLDLLEELILSENEIEQLPTSMAGMSQLRILKLQNNNLYSLPHQLSLVLTLEDVDCSNNPKLSMIPYKWRGDTESILFMCRIFNNHAIQMEDLLSTNMDLSKHSQFLEHEHLLVQEKVRDLTRDIETMELYLTSHGKAQVEKEKTRRQQGMNVSTTLKSSSNRDCIVS